MDLRSAALVLAGMLGCWDAGMLGGAMASIRPTMLGMKYEGRAKAAMQGCWLLVVGC